MQSPALDRLLEDLCRLACHAGRPSGRRRAPQ